MTQYFYNLNDEQKGPISFEDLKNLISSKEIKSNTLIWKEGLEDWIKASEAEEFKSLFLIPLVFVMTIDTKIIELSSQFSC